MTNCPGLLGTKEVLSTDKYEFKNTESPEQMGRTGLLREQLIQHWRESQDVKATNKKDTPRSWAHSGTGAITENQEAGIQE